MKPEIDKVDKALLALAEERGRISPEIVLDTARDPASELHSKFEWDDTKAGEGFRLMQAAALIRRVRIKIEVQSTEPTRVKLIMQRAIVSLPSLRGSEDGSYLPLTRIGPSEAEELAREALEQLKRLKAQYEHIEALRGVWKAVEALEDTTGRE